MDVGHFFRAQHVVQLPDRFSEGDLHQCHSVRDCVGSAVFQIIALANKPQGTCKTILMRSRHTLRCQIGTTQPSPIVSLSIALRPGAYASLIAHTSLLTVLECTLSSTTTTLVVWLLRIASRRWSALNKAKVSTYTQSTRWAHRTWLRSIR